MIAHAAAAVTLHLTPPDYTRLDNTAPYSARPHHRHTFAERRARRRHRLRARVVEAAASFIGVPYVWGGTSRSGVDCSGLTTLAYRSIGRWIPRTTWGQRYVGIPVRGDLRRGDLILEYGNSHVQIYAGHGMVIAAQRSGTVVSRLPLNRALVSSIRRVIHRG